MDSKNRSLLHRINQVSFFDGFSHKEKGKLIEKVEMFKKYEKKGGPFFQRGPKVNRCMWFWKGLLVLQG